MPSFCPSSAVSQVLGLVVRVVRPTGEGLTLLDRFLCLHSELVESHGLNVRVEGPLARNVRTELP